MLRKITLLNLSRSSCSSLRFSTATNVVSSQSSTHLITIPDAPIGEISCWRQQIAVGVYKIICHAKIYHSVAENLKSTTVLIIHLFCLFNYSISIERKILIWLHPAAHITIKPYICSTASIVTQTSMRCNSVIVGLAEQAKAQQNHSCYRQDSKQHFHLLITSDIVCP